MSELLNLVGLSAGIVLYAMLLAMVVRASRTAGARFDPLLLATAVLGLVWNLCALPVYELPKAGIERPFPALIVVGFAALGFLPAVVVQSVLRGDRERVHGPANRTIAAIAYAVSAVAAVLSARAAWIGDPIPSPLGMRLLTYTFIGLVVPLAAMTRRQPGARRALWAAALAIFAVSALHLSQLHPGDASWPIELLGHHASVPLAFAILYQDFPFALADIFLKRALTLMALVGAAVMGVALVGAIHSPDVPLRDPRDVGLLVTLWVGTALLYPRLRDSIAWFVDHVLLDRPDYAELRVRIGALALRHQEVPALLDDVCAQLAPALSARAVRWREASANAPAISGRIDIPVVEPPRFEIDVLELTGGRRLLSDDQSALEAVALIVGRRIDAIRLAHERYDRQLREREADKLTAEAELRALRAQINPHFLFNALTTIGYLIQTAPPRALNTLMRLTALLRSVLRSDSDYTTLGHEIELVEAYLDIERARFEDRLRVTIDVPYALRGVRVPPLVLQPIVENAITHGIAAQVRGGDVSVIARVEPGDNGTATLMLTIRDTGAGASPDAFRRGRATGLGLTNVERRLACQFGANAALTVTSAPGTGTIVDVRLPMDHGRPSAQPSSRST